MFSLLAPSAPGAAVRPGSGEHVVALRSVVASAWHGLSHAAVTSPWFAIALMVPAVGLLVGCMRRTVRRG